MDRLWSNPRWIFGRVIHFNENSNSTMSALEIWDAVRDVLKDAPKRKILERKSLKLVQHLVDILRQFEDEELYIDELEEIEKIEDAEEDPDYDPELGSKVVATFPTDPTNPNMVRFGEKLVSVIKVQEALDYYGSYGAAKRRGSKRPSLSTMTRRFSFIQNENHLKKLREFECNGISINIHNAMKFVADELYKEVFKHMDDGLILHDDDLRSMAMAIVKKNKLNIKFTASDSWINSWKRAHRVTSRRITKFVSRKRFVDAAALKKKADDFVTKTKQIMGNYDEDQVYNADQSGFIFEMHSMRTLARTGSRNVEIVVRSESNMKKSYTVMPMVRADGTFAPKLFVVLKEPNGKFPSKGHFQTHNLVVKAYSTHMMTKNLMMEFFEEVVFDPNMPDKQLLLIDSWSSWKDNASINSVKPASKSLETLIIPAGCTGMVQPLDVGVFGQFKKIMKKINAFAQRNHPDFHVAVRDNLLKVTSLVFWQLCHSDLKEWVRHAWFAAGYLQTHPTPYRTPYQQLFPDNVTEDCNIANCQSFSFILCLYCKKKICFSHFVEKYHKC